MASAAEDIQILNDFYLGPETPQGGPAFVKARRNSVKAAMEDLVWRASVDPNDRKLFAETSMLEKALGFGPKREGQHKIPGTLGVETILPIDARLAMLEGIYKSASGGVWAAPTPAGITTWLGSEYGGKANFITALETDPDPRVRAVLLKIVRDVAVPASWFATFKERRIFEKLDVQAREADWGVFERRAVSALSGQADGRTSVALAQLALGDLSKLPAFPTGEGALAPTAPAPAKRWYRSGWTWLASGSGLVAGFALRGR